MRRSVWLCALLCISVSGGGREGRGDTSRPPDAKASSVSPTSVTHHALQIRGQALKYTATAGFLPIHDQQGKVKAEMFFTAYNKEEEKDASRRPIAFAFNGGPGASSLWLHIGGLGPKRTPLAENGTALPSSAKLVDNEETWLDFTDLVFIDPVGTGYSRAAPGTDAKQFYDVDEDVQAAASFIRLYLTRYGRWLSPKYLVGESYGTTRSAALAQHLQSQDGINLRGVVLLSSALDFQTFSVSRNNDLASALILPSYTATAWYHKRLAPRLQADLQKTLAEVQNWAIAEYLPALAKGQALPDAERQKVAARLADYTGLSKEYVERSDLRISQARFAKELLADRQEKLGVLDSRVVGAALTPWTDLERGDPALTLVTGPLVATLNAYLRTALQYRSDSPYQFLSMSANHSWKWGSAVNGYVNVAPKLKEALSSNPRLRLFMGAGYYDLTTPYFSQIYTHNHLGLTRKLWQHTVCRVYSAGHQIYTSPPAMRELKADVAKFFEGDES